MTDWNLERRDGSFFVVGLADVWASAPYTFLLVRYPAGDCDHVTEVGENMHSALYDLYQCSDQLKAGDRFLVDGVPVFRCVGVHVVPNDWIDSGTGDNAISKAP